MCIIIDNTTGGTIPPEHLKNAAAANADGLGLAYVENGRVYVLKSTESADFPRLFEKYNRPGAVWHFRIATHGSEKKSNCHPFCVLSKDAGDPVDVVMFHNGILDITDEHRRGKADDRTDSEIFATEFLRPILRANWKLIYKRAFADMLSAVCGYSSKLVFLLSDGGHVRINEALGEEKDGVWYSNKSAFNEPARWPAYGYDYDTADGYAGAYYTRRTYALEQYAYELMTYCPADNRGGGLYVYRFSDGADTDARLNAQPSYFGPGAAKYNAGLAAAVITTDKGQYFFDAGLMAWFEIAGPLEEFAAEINAGRVPAIIGA